MRWLQRA